MIIIGSRVQIIKNQAFVGTVVGLFTEQEPSGDPIPMAQILYDESCGSAELANHQPISSLTQLS
jgi:hypothetical protein